MDAVDGESASQTQSGATVSAAPCGRARRSVRPAGEIRHEDVLAKVELRLIDNPPATRTCVTKLQRPDQLTA
jgi:hypothetical protein